MTTRRTFLALAGAAAASPLVTYAEPLLLVPDTHRGWIEDKGEYFIVRVPAGKTFSRETFTKPVILLMGSGAWVRDISVSAYMNVSAQDGCLLDRVLVDASSATTVQPRPTVRIKGANCQFRGWSITAGRGDTVGLHIEDSHEMAIGSPWIDMRRQRTG